MLFSIRPHLHHEYGRLRKDSRDDVYLAEAKHVAILVAMRNMEEVPPATRMIVGCDAAAAAVVVVVAVMVVAAVAVAGEVAVEWDLEGKLTDGAR